MTTAPNPAELAAARLAESIASNADDFIVMEWCGSEYTGEGAEYPRVHVAALREIILRDLASGLSAGAEEVGAGPWTVTGPDHPVFRGESPIKAAMEAQRYRRQTDPVEAEKFLAAVDSIRKEGEEEDKRLIALHGSLDCPACGGSGHVGDTKLSDQEWRDLRRFDETSRDDNSYDVPKERMKRLAQIGAVRRVTGNRYEHTDFGLALLAAPAATPPAEKEVRVPQAWGGIDATGKLVDCSLSREDIEHAGLRAVPLGIQGEDA